MGVVKILFTGDASRLLREQSKVQRKQDDLSQSMRKTEQASSRAGKRTESSFSAGAVALQGLKAGALAGATAIGSITAAAAALGKQLEDNNREVADLEMSLRKVAALGDNAANLPNIRERTRKLSEQYHYQPDVIAESMRAIQSAAGDMPQAQQEQVLRGALDMARIHGAEDPGAFSPMILKTAQSFQDVPIDKITDMLAKGMDIADVSAQTMARGMPEVSAAAKLRGTNLDTLMAALTVGTQVAGDPRKAFTQMRNIETIMAEQEARGRFKGSYAQDLEELAGMDAAALSKLFGKENITVAKGLIDRRGEIAGLRETYDGVGDITGQTWANYMADDQFRQAWEDRASSIARQNERKFAPVSGAGLRYKAIDEWIEREWAWTRNVPGSSDFIAASGFAANQMARPFFGDVIADPVIGVNQMRRMQRGVPANLNYREDYGISTNPTDRLFYAPDRQSEPGGGQRNLYDINAEMKAAMREGAREGIREGLREERGGVPDPSGEGE
jgi:hypothetical protein